MSQHEPPAPADAEAAEAAGALTRRQVVLQLGSFSALGIAAGPSVLLAGCGGGGGSGGTAPGDTTAPTVSSTAPANGATGVAVNTQPTVTFSEAMGSSSITTSSFTLARTSSGAAIAGSVSASGSSATFTPSAPLPGGTQFTATVTTAAQDVAGNALGAPFSWQFTTVTVPVDSTPPTVTATTPSANATGVATGTTVSATFSEPMNNATLSTASFRLATSTGGAAVSGSVAISGNTATFTPAAALAGGTQYTATITTAATDAAGNALASNFTWQFTTVATDTTPPTVSSTFPANGAASADVNGAITATFSEAMNSSTLTTASVRLATTSGGITVSGSVSLSGRTVTFTPSTPLAAGTQYTGTITTAARDVAGNPLASNFTWTFTTAAASTAPALGAHRLVFNPFQVNAGSVATPSMVTQATGSTLVACVGRGDIAAHVAPTDNKGNTFTQRGSTQAYVPRYPNSGTALYAVDAAAGGSGHVVTASNAISPTDEVTLAVVEVQHGGRVDFRWNMVQAGNPLTSPSITTTGPATLVAFWWGDADGSVAHTATPGDGFTQIDAVLTAGSLVQCAVAAKSVAAAGTYAITWTATPTQGAQLWLVAVESA